MSQRPVTCTKTDCTAPSCAPDCAPSAPATGLVQLRRGGGTSRRSILQAAAGGVAAAVAAPACNTPEFEAYFQKHYKKLTDEEKVKVFARLEEKTRQKTGVRVRIGDPPPIEGVHFAYALNLSHCNGNRRCAEACARENNLPDEPEMRYIRVLELDNGSQHLERGTVYYDREKVPAPGKFYLPVQCHQCDNAPCVKACPTGATWKENDGIVVVDYDWCIGCRYCQAACPYHARRFNWVEPKIEPSRINPHQAYLSNRIRQMGVVEKCTFCLQRTRRGMYPACYEVCPTGARKFGDLSDPESEVRQIVENKRVWILKEDLGTEPRFFYFYG
ncbi:MAG: 4Fe-4S dicluster domain-containing protein [Polyangiaceae bacterium]|nr:4Fe-4S dicluster domain-containing protein [Polyangiaceae bacterium]